MSDTRRDWESPTACDPMADIGLTLQGEIKTCKLAQEMVLHVVSIPGVPAKEHQALLDAARALLALAAAALDRSAEVVRLVSQGAALGHLERALQEQPTPKTFKEIE